MFSYPSIRAYCPALAIRPSVALGTKERTWGRAPKTSPKMLWFEISSSSLVEAVIALLVAIQAGGFYDLLAR